MKHYFVILQFDRNHSGKTESNLDIFISMLFADIKLQKNHCRITFTQEARNQTKIMHFK
jgi:hypothetical protein